MNPYLIGYLILTNLARFVLFGVDKYRAKNHLWRIPEKTLFLSALVGGALGCLIGMYFFHHKTRHWYFRIGIPVILVLNLLILTLILLPA